MADLSQPSEWERRGDALLMFGTCQPPPMIFLDEIALRAKAGLCQKVATGGAAGGHLTSGKPTLSPLSYRPLAVSFATLANI